MSALECSGAMIFDPQGRLFVQRRSPSRALFPNCWDIVGGHVEPGESPEQTMRRELFEETGWQVDTIHSVLEPIAWTGDDGKARLEYDFLVAVAGDLSRPALEVGKHTEWRWITAEQTALLNQDRRYGDSLILELVQLGFDRAQEIGLSPSYASVIAPHVDRVFKDIMAAAREGGGRELVAAHGLPTAGPLIDYRLILPVRPLTPSERDAVSRYWDPSAAFLEQQALGTVTVAADGTVTLTDRGRAFYNDLFALHERVAQRLPPMPLLDVVLGQEHRDGPLHTFDNLARLRQLRADAHAAAWQAAGLTADDMPLAPGPERDAIEAETNRLAGMPYLERLTVTERFELLTCLSEL